MNAIFFADKRDPKSFISIEVSPSGASDKHQKVKKIVG